MTQRATSLEKHKFVNDGHSRCSLEEAAAAGLVAMRAAGLEPSDAAKELMARVIAGEIIPREMEALLITKYRGGTTA